MTIRSIAIVVALLGLVPTGSLACSQHLFSSRSQIILVEPNEGNSRVEVKLTDGKIVPVYVDAEECLALYTVQAGSRKRFCSGLLVDI